MDNLILKELESIHRDMIEEIRKVGQIITKNLSLQVFSNVEKERNVDLWMDTRNEVLEEDVDSVNISTDEDGPGPCSEDASKVCVQINVKEELDEEDSFFENREPMNSLEFQSVSVVPWINSIIAKPHSHTEVEEKSIPQQVQNTFRANSAQSNVVSECNINKICEPSQDSVTDGVAIVSNSFASSDNLQLQLPRQFHNENEVVQDAGTSKFTNSSNSLMTCVNNKIASQVYQHSRDFYSGSEGGNAVAQMPINRFGLPSMVPIQRRFVKQDAHIKPKMKTHQCKECGKFFSQKGTLTRHMVIHSGKKQFECKDCGKCFTYQNTLKHHTRTHTGEKPYQCSVCGNWYRFIASFKQHMRTHTGEKPYLCNVCGKMFNQATSMRRHARIHTGEKPYKCDVCSQAFSYKWVLMKHQSVHNSEKPVELIDS